MKSHPSSLSQLAVAVVSAFLLATQVQAAPLGQLNPGRVEMPDKAGVRSSPTEMPGTLELPDTVITPETEPQELQAFPSARFSVNKVILVGASSYPAGTFDAVLKRLEGHSVNLAEVHAVADTITARYRQAGFLLAKTIVPAQRLEGGNLVLQVFEGKVNQVTFSGPSNKALGRYADNIRQETPPTSKTIERNLLLMNDVSGNDSRGTLQASPVESGTDLIVENACASTRLLRLRQP